MPARAVLNVSFLIAASMSGMNTPISDLTDESLRFAPLSVALFLKHNRRVWIYKSS
jgi:hypothetical protein